MTGNSGPPLSGTSRAVARAGRAENNTAQAEQASGSAAGRVTRLPPQSFFLVSAVFHYLGAHRLLYCCSLASMFLASPGYVSLPLRRCSPYGGGPGG